jgi:drug/metabolite transporter (DMT)-like permease
VNIFTCAAKTVTADTMDDAAKGLLITLLGVLLLVPDSLFVRLINASAWTIDFWRLLLAGSLLGLLMLVWKGIDPFRAVLETGRFGALYMFGVGASGLLFILAVSLTSVANVVFIIASLPIFATLYSRVFLAEPISVRMLLTMALVVAGLAVIAYGSGTTENASLAGDALALGASALFAAALTAARRVRPVSMVPGVAMGFVLAALAILPFADPFSVPDTQIPLVLAHGGFILGSSILLAIGPRYITSAEVGLLVLLESALAPLLAWLVVGEDPGAYALAGGAIVIGALFVSNLWVLARARVRSPR